MPLLQLLVATLALVAGSLALAASAERSSLSRRLLVAAVLVPAQITVLVLVLGWFFGAFRPIVLLVAALVVGGGEVLLLRRRTSWDGPMAPVAAARGAGRGLWHHKLIGAVVLLTGVLVAWQTARAVRVPDTTWDSLDYHLPEPSTWVLWGQLGRSGLSLFGAGYPQGQEVLHGWTMVFLHSIRGTGLVPLWLGAIGALSVYRLARHVGATAASAALGAAVLLGMPAAALQIGTAYVDLGAAAFALAALALALEARTADAPLALLAVASAAAGLAIATKPSMAPVVITVAVVGGLVSRRPVGEGRLAPVVGGWLAGTLLVVGLGGIWYLTSWVNHGNPFYPVSMLGFRGEGTFQELVRNTQTPDRLRGAVLPVQLWHSWTADLRHHPFDYDHREGGLGAVWLLCLPALGVLGVRLWRRDRVALGLLAWTGLATWLVSGSGWWARYSLVLAGIGCAALAVLVDVLRPAPVPAGRADRRPSPARRLAAPALGTVVLVAVAFTTVSALSPTSEYALENTVPYTRMPTGELAGVIVRGDGAEVLRPWGAFSGLDELEDGTTIAYVGRHGVTFPQVLIGIDLDHRVVALAPPESPAVLLATLQAIGARYLFVDAASGPNSMEALTTADGLHFRPVETEGLVTGGTMWEVGTFDECGEGRLELDLREEGSDVTASGRLTDDCGAIGGAPVEIYRAGDGDDPWTDATRVSRGITTNDDGYLLAEVPGAEGGEGVQYFGRFVGRSEDDRYRPPAASPLLTVAS